MARYGDNPKPPKFRPLGVEIATVTNPSADSVGHPAVSIPRLGIKSITCVATLMDFNPATGVGAGPPGTNHTHPLTGPTFHTGDQVLVAFQGANHNWPVVLGRCG